MACPGPAPEETPALVRALPIADAVGPPGRDVQRAPEVSTDKKACKIGCSLERPGTRICRDVFQKGGPQGQQAERFSPANRLKADARTRTGDPFITRERQVRDARPFA